MNDASMQNQVCTLTTNKSADQLSETKLPQKRDRPENDELDQIERDSKDSKRQKKFDWKHLLIEKNE